MKRIQRLIAIAGLTAILAAGAPAPASAASGEFNDEYVYATTRAVNRMDAPAGAKVTLYPLTLVVDTAFLPFAVIAGFMTA
jgi:uncharacterized protein YceK